MPVIAAVDGVQQAKQGDGISPPTDGDEVTPTGHEQAAAVQLLIEILNEAARRGHNALMKKRSYHNVMLAVVAVLALPALADDETLDDLLTNAKPAATKPAEVTGPTTAPDALGTMKPRTPAGARIGLVTLSDKTGFEGRVWTTLDTPFRVWQEDLKSYRDVALGLVKDIHVVVLSRKMEDDWRWLKEGSDVKIFSGKKYPNVELEYTFTLLNGQVITGPVVAPVYVYDGNKTRTLALYKKYKGKLDETLENVVFIESIKLSTPEVVTTAAEKRTRKLPLLD